MAPELLAIYNIIYKTKDKRLREILNEYVRKFNKPLPPETEEEGRMDPIVKARFSIKFNKEELEHKYATSRRIYGKSEPVAEQQKILIGKYLEFTRQLLESIPVQNQNSKSFHARTILDKFEDFYAHTFGPEWLEDRDGFLQKYSMLVRN